MKKYLKTPEEVIEALQDGKVIKTDGDAIIPSYNWRIHKGMIISLRCSDQEIFVGGGVSINQNPYIEIEDPKPALKLEVGKYYKTRGGEKAFCYFCGNKQELYPYFMVIVGVEGRGFEVTSGGLFLSNSSNVNDIIAPWEEEHAEND